VLYSVLQLHTVISTLIWTFLTSGLAPVGLGSCRGRSRRHSWGRGVTVGKRVQDASGWKLILVLSKHAYCWDVCRLLRFCQKEKPCIWSSGGAITLLSSLSYGQFKHQLKTFLFGWNWLWLIVTVCFFVPKTYFYLLTYCCVCMQVLTSLASRVAATTCCLSILLSSSTELLQLTSCHSSRRVQSCENQLKVAQLDLFLFFKILFLVLVF